MLLWYSKPQTTVQKVYYLLFFSSLVCLFPYYNLYYESLGFTEKQIGVLTSVRPWLTAFAGNVVSSIADATSLHRPIFISGYCLAVLLRCLMGALSAFGLILATVFVASLLGEPVYILADTAVMSYAVEDPGYFGRVRLWGAVGWGALSPLAGLLIDHAGLKAAFWAYGTIAACAVVPVVMMDFGRVDASHNIVESHRALKSRRFDIQLADVEGLEEIQSLVQPGNDADDDHEETVTERHKSLANGKQALPQEDDLDDTSVQLATPEAAKLPFLQRLQLLLSNPEMLLFLSMALVMGYGVGTIDGYLFLFLRQQGASAFLMGSTLTITCVAEVPVFHYSGAILRTLGVNKVLHIVLAAFLLRLLAYACLPYYPPWCVLPVELLHGITFGCAWAVGLWNAKRLAVPGTEATTQAMFQSLYMGLGHGIAGLTGGFVYSAAGLQMVFISAAFVILTAWACIGVAHWLLVRKPSA